MHGRPPLETDAEARTRGPDRWRILPPKMAADPVTARASRRSSGLAAVIALALLSLLASASACGSASPSAIEPPATPASSPTTTVDRPSDPVDELVAIEGGRLHVRCVGHGPATVVLIAGWGDPADSWGRIEPALAGRARVCSYARFGLGTSDEPRTTQTFATQAQDLHALLAAIHEPGPYLLVGHSFGGAQAVTFASLFPQEVTGLVLLDAPPTSWISAACAVPDDGSEAAKSFALTCSMATEPETNPEHLDAATGMAEAAQITSLGSVPLAVLVASDHPRPGLAAAEDDRLAGVLSTGAERWAALSPLGQVTTVANSGHYIQVDQPDVVIHAVEALL